MSLLCDSAHLEAVSDVPREFAGTDVVALIQSDVL